MEIINISDEAYEKFFLQDRSLTLEERQKIMDRIADHMEREYRRKMRKLKLQKIEENIRNRGQSSGNI